VQAVTALAANAWHHIAATYDGANARIYLNGKQDNSAALTGNITSETGDTVYIGKNDNGNFFEGRIEGVRIYRRAITADEVRWLYAEPYAGLMPSPNMFLVGAAAGAVTVPLFRHHYVMQRGM
jgi:hypothetical protein